MTGLQLGLTIGGIIGLLGAVVRYRYLSGEDAPTLVDLLGRVLAGILYGGLVGYGIGKIESFGPGYKTAFTWGVAVGGMVGVWGSVRRSNELRGGRLASSGVLLVAGITTTILAALTGGAIGLGVRWLFR